MVIQTARLSLSKLSVLMTLTGAICLAAQNSPPARGPTAGAAATLPKSCLVRAGASEKISALLESVQDRPTAGAYNTLGVLYAQAERLSCAVPAFEASLKLENQNWEAHYNLALALLSRGDRAGAERELRTTIQQKPDAVSSHFALGTLLESEKKIRTGGRRISSGCED